jgi:DNA-binding response OmpR family regulator
MIRVLLIDNSLDAGNLIKAELIREGFDVRACTARDQLCLDLVRDFRPHAILVDYQVSGLGLKEFIAEVRLTGLNAQTILLSELSTEATQAARELNLSFLNKPFELEALYEILNRITGSGEHVAVDQD